MRQTSYPQHSALYCPLSTATQAPVHTHCNSLDGQRGLSGGSRYLTQGRSCPQQCIPPKGQWLPSTSRSACFAVRIQSGSFMPPVTSLTDSHHVALHVSRALAEPRNSLLILFLSYPELQGSLWIGHMSFSRAVLH